MTELLIRVILTAFGIVFIHSTTWEGMIFGRVRRWMYRAPVWLRKPTYMCMICMTSVWGTLLWFNPFEFITYLFATGGILVFFSFLLPDR